MQWQLDPVTLSPSPFSLQLVSSVNALCLSPLPDDDVYIRIPVVSRYVSHRHIPVCATVCNRLDPRLVASTVCCEGSRLSRRLARCTNLW